MRKVANKKQNVDDCQKNDNRPFLKKKDTKKKLYVTARGGHNCNLGSIIQAILSRYLDTYLAQVEYALLDIRLPFTLDGDDNDDDNDFLRLYFRAGAFLCFSSVLA